jgi:hypothetical protein
MKFNPKYVHYMWNDELEGKKVFVADTIPNLRKAVEEENEEFYSSIYFKDEDLPFDCGCCYRFCYYNPSYKGM